jgi:hypothetical protein
MFKKLIAAVFVLSFLLALSTAAFAFKDPNHIKTLPNTLPSAQKPGAEFQIAAPEQPPQFSKPISAALPAVGLTEPPSRQPTECTALSYHDGIPYWYWPIPDDYGDDFFNMRFTPTPDQECELTTVAICLYDGGSTVITSSGIDVIVWDDDGFGFPGVERARINVPASQVIWYPWYTVVDFSPFEIEYIGDDFHVGYTTVDQVNDVYAVLSDEGTTGTLRSSEFYLGMWGTMYNDWGLDVNFMIEADICCETGPVTQCMFLNYGTYIPYYYWTIPDSYGDDFFNERFTNINPNPCTLVTGYLGFYAGGSIDVTGEGVDVIVWDDDGLGYPNLVLATVNVPTASITWYPGETAVDFRPFNLVFGSGVDFHIGYTTVNQGAGNVMACLSDDGTGPAEYRSSELYLGVWGFMIDDWGIDVDFIITAELCCGGPPPPSECEWLFYNGDAAYYWPIPDAYGDDYFNMRFTHLDPCTVMTLEIAFYAGGSVGSPGADFILFNSNGTFPTDTIAVYSVPVVTTWFPGYESVDCSADNIVITGDYHLGYTPIYNDPADVLACLSDDGSMGTLRSSEYWFGFWGLMIDDWSVDVNFLMSVYKCCPGVEPILCQDEGEWPTLSQNFARAGYLDVEVGDMCGFERIWDYYSPYDFCYFSNPIIADEKVYVTFGVHAICLDVYTGAVIWETSAIPAYGSILGGAVRTTMTFEYGLADTNYVYFSGGTFQSFVKADASTGQVHWYRGGIGSPLGLLEGSPGAMRFCPSVIIGDFIYFGGDGGTMYKLNKNTGVTAAFVGTPYGNSVWVSPSSDGENVYIGCAEGLTGGDAGSGSAAGAVYKYDGNLNLLSPYTGNIGWNEGCTGGPTYSATEDALYFQVEYAEPVSPYTATDGFTQKADAATMGPHADNSYYFCGEGFYANPAVDSNLQYVFFGNYAYRDARFDGLWVKTFEFNTAWQDFAKGTMTNPAGVSCDPFVFWGSRVHPYGHFNCNQAATGVPEFSYNLTGYGFGPAIARYYVRDDDDYMPFVAHTQIWSDCETGGGRVAMYSHGEDRPRLSIPSYEVEVDPPLDFVDPDGTERSAEIFCNTGCVGLKYCLELEAHSSYPVKNFSTVNPQRLSRVDKEADRIIEYSLYDFNIMEGWKEARMNRSPLKSEIGDRPATKERDAWTASAPPSWVTLVSPDCGILRVMDCYEATFAFTVTAMARGQNLFYVAIATDDPDYNECDLDGYIDCCHGLLAVNDYVLVNAVKGFAFCDGYLDFGDGGDDWEYVNNSGWFDDGSVSDALTVDGTDDPLYQGGFFWGVDSNRVAWLEEGGKGFDHLFADTVCTLIENMYMGEMYYADGSSVSIYGDYFESAVIDSIFDYTTEQLSNALTMGLRMSFREWGAFGPEFNNFKIIAYDLYNRNAAAIDDVYWGLFADWDMPGDAGGYEQVEGVIDLGVSYQFNEVSFELAGFGTLPMPGSFVDDGTKALVKTTGMYNGYGISNPDEVYPPAELPTTFFQSIDNCPEGDWCYHPNAAPGATPDDRGMIHTSGKMSFAGNQVVSGAFVVYNYPGGVGATTIQDMMKFADKFCGYKRGDMNDDGEITLNDLVVLILYLNGGNAPYPFLHLGDVNADGLVDGADAQYFYDFFFLGGPPPQSKLAR